MRTKIRERLSKFILLWIPADDPPTETTPAPGETTPAPGETTPAPGETTPQPGETTPAAGETTPAADPAPDMVPRAELDQVRAEHDARVREEAERLLMETDPQAYPGPSREPMYTPPASTEAPAEPQLEWNDMSDEQRQNFLYDQNKQILSNQETMHNQSQAGHLIDKLERLKAGDFPQLDLNECLGVLTRRPGARIEKLAEISHRRGIDRGDKIAEARLEDPQFRESHGLPALDPNNPGGTPAPQTSVPGRTAPLLPGPGPTTTGAQPVTMKNAGSVLRDRIRASGFANS